MHKFQATFVISCGAFIGCRCSLVVVWQSLFGVYLWACVARHGFKKNCMLQNKLHASNKNCYWFQTKLDASIKTACFKKTMLLQKEKEKETETEKERIKGRERERKEKEEYRLDVVNYTTPSTPYEKPKSLGYGGRVPDCLWGQRTFANLPGPYGDWDGDGDGDAYGGGDGRWR